MNILNLVKRVFCLCLALLLILTLAACGEKVDSSETPAKADTEENLILESVPEPEEEPEPEPEPPIPFTDVPEDASYYDTVVWAYESGIVSDGSTFEPDSTCTRAQVIMFLWRATGSPEPQTAEAPFSDVSSANWYYKPALWAYENHIITGTTFNPDSPCTNAKALTFLWRAEGKPMAAVYSSPIALTDSDSYYARPVAWAENNGMFAGMDSAFDPAAPCRRSDIVTYLRWATEQWMFTEEEKTVQAEYEQIINDAQLYEVHGSGLIYADYVDVEEDGKVELLTLDFDEEIVTLTATVYANIGGHAGKFCEETFDAALWNEAISLCKADGHLQLSLYATSISYEYVFSEIYQFYKIEDGAFVLDNELIKETGPTSGGDGIKYAYNTSDKEITADEFKAILQKHTDEKPLVGNLDFIMDRGLLPTKAEYWEANCDQVYADVLEGDFSYFAGYYAGAGQGGESDAILDQNGNLTQQYPTWSYQIAPPISITIKESGAIHCECREPTFWEPEDVDNDGEPDLGGYYLVEYYDIYPIGVGEEWVDPDGIGASRHFYDNLDKVRIHYFAVDGGIGDDYYCKES